ncbi:hypothetical protein BTJ68_03712 [Hortaea werneckii EXF-2000]|uniref:Malate dehydrogenase n=1 Tax=Hortaea werneckii EXF-2000 TaxID=1157616 RepID=A0A1Z5TLU5_HORWE|nr:hypothetical protein BTJ68_03712 [Hortaea werneckii EXF-2000]
MADEQHEQQNLIYVSAQEAQAYAERVLQANGLTATNATTVARGLVAADLRGIDTHGINRLPSYLTRIRQGVLDPHAEPTLHVKTPVAAQIDAHNNFGFIAAAQGIQHACTVAETYGIGMVSIKHSNHFGMSAHLCQTALDHPSGPMMSLVFTNSSPLCLRTADDPNSSASAPSPAAPPADPTIRISSSTWRRRSPRGGKSTRRYGAGRRSRWTGRLMARGHRRTTRPRRSKTAPSCYPWGDPRAPPSPS